MNDKKSKSIFTRRIIIKKGHGHGAFCYLDVNVNVNNSHKTLLIVLELLRHNRADLSNEKNLGEINNNNNNNNSNNNNCKCLFSS